MNIYLKEFIRGRNPGKALGLGVSDPKDVQLMNELGWDCVEVSKGVDSDLKYPHASPKGPFDLVYSNYILHKIKNKKVFVKTIYDNLKKGGDFFVHTFHVLDEVVSGGFEIDEINKLFSNFKNTKIEVFDFYDNEEGHKCWHKILEIIGKK